MSDREERKISFVLPAYVTELGFSCCRESMESYPSFSCGCPNCLDKIGLTLIFDVEDWNKEGMPLENCRQRIVSLRTGRLAKHLICPGYPGHDAAAAERRRRPTESSGDTPQSESLPTVD